MSIHMIGLFIYAGGLGLHMSASIGITANRIRAKDAYLIGAVGSSVNVVASLLIWRSLVALNLILMVLCLWMWWKSGGDDDTKRRWRSFAKKFQGVRRTAPATA